MSKEYEFILKTKEDRIDRLLNKLDKFEEKYDRDTTYLMKQNKKFEEKYDRDISLLMNDNKELKLKLEILEQKLEDKVINPINKNKIHYLLVLQNIENKNKFKCLRIQKETLKKELNKYENKYNIIFKSDVLPSIRKNGVFKIKNYYENKLNKLEELKNEIKNNNKELKETLKDLKNDNKELKLKLESIEQKLEHRVINPINSNKLHQLVILKNINDNYKFKCLRKQKKTIDKDIKQYENEYKVFFKNYEPNAVSLFQLSKRYFI
ncbi:hypothetical protein Avbf_05478 [Armadillidium vulgare]|nr:hypothetical protein Avbf_05478 [Armadillidium vulgare]